MSMTEGTAVLQDDQAQHQLPEGLDGAWQRAQQQDKYMVAVWYVEDGKLVVYRQTHNFPVADLGKAVELLGQNLKETAS
jgi:hypothetical protein